MCRNKNENKTFRQTYQTTHYMYFMTFLHAWTKKQKPYKYKITCVSDCHSYVCDYVMYFSK